MERDRILWGGVATTHYDSRMSLFHKLISKFASDTVAENETKKTASVLLSVIVPFRDVQEYFSECLESIAKQGIESMEVILVDDHSTDESHAFATGFKAAHPEVSVVLVDSIGTGPGPARNTGLEYVTGKYLTFVDSDDRVPAGAFKTLIRSASKNDAEIVVGAPIRFDSTRSWTPRWVGEVHSYTQVGIHAAEFPAVLRNNYGWGKLYSSTFWRSQGLSFEAENIIYEDQPLIARLLWRASAVNVLSDVVYEYRRRDDFSSISQRPWEPKDLRDRITAWDRTRDALDEDNVGNEVVSGWVRTLLSTHFHWYLYSEQTLGTSEWSSLREAYFRLPQEIVVSLWPSLNARQKIALAALRDDRRELWEKLSATLGAKNLVQESIQSGVKTHVPDELSAVLSGLDCVSPWPTVPFDFTVLRAQWDFDSFLLKLDLGHRINAGIPANFGLSLLIKARGSIERVFDLDRLKLSKWERTYWAGRGVFDVSRASIDVGSVSGDIASLPAESSLWLRLQAENQTFDFPIVQRLSVGGALELSTMSISASKQIRLAPGRNGRAPLRLLVESPKIAVNSVTWEHDDLEIKLRSGSRLMSMRIRAGDRDISLPITLESDSNYVAKVSLSELSGLLTGLEKSQNFGVTVTADEKKFVGVDWPSGRVNESLGQYVQGVFRALPSARGKLILEYYPFGLCLVTTIDTNKCDGQVVLPESSKLSLNSGVTASDGRNVHFELNLDAMLSDQGESQTEPFAEVLRKDRAQGYAPLIADINTLGALPVIGNDWVASRFKPRGINVNGLKQ